MSQQGNEHPTGAPSVLDAVREYEDLEFVLAGEIGFDPGAREVKAKADAAIAALEDRAEKAEYAAKENREAMDNAVAAWREAEAEVARLRKMLELAYVLDRDAIDNESLDEYLALLARRVEET